MNEREKLLADIAELRGRMEAYGEMSKLIAASFQSGDNAVTVIESLGRLVDAKTATAVREMVTITARLEASLEDLT